MTEHPAASRPPLAVIVLAAGLGTRMKSDVPKVLHEVCGRPMLAYVLDACRSAGCRKPIVVIGHDAPRVRRTFAHLDGQVQWVEQTQQLGTGHAVMMCQDQLASAEGPVLVLAGDGPLVQTQTLSKLLSAHAAKPAACTLATSILPDPARYGRIVRDERGELSGIVEYLDAAEAQRQIREVNVSLYCFDAAALRGALPQLKNDNAKKEYYLTDVLGILRGMGQKVQALPAVPADEVLSINTLEELAQVERVLKQRLAAGVRT
jgi:bifunctional UDP-N-acetylglucosamine pyrophosphorylase / glucosamine-1-phosphate N-acetyltransferase